MDPLREAALNVRDAIRDPGPHPEHHAGVMDQSRRTWPTLWDALDRLLAALDGEVDVPPSEEP